MTAIFWVPALAPVRLAVVERPRGGAWLGDDLAAFRRGGIDVLVSALQPKEERDLSLVEEERHATEAGLEFVRFPIANLGTPPLEIALPILHSLAEAARAGRGVAAHCWASQGRSPTIIAAVSVLLGHHPDHIWPAIREARGIPVPDTNEQRAWVASIAAAVPRIEAR